MDTLPSTFVEISANTSIANRNETYRELVEQKNLFASVEASEKRLRLAIEGADVGVWHWDLLEDTMVWSDKCVAILGVSPDVVGDIDSFMACMHPQDRIAIYQKVHASIVDGADIVGDCRILRPDNSVRWIDVKGRVIIDSNGTPVRAEGVLLDITDRKRAENLSNIQRRVLQGIATGAPLSSTLHVITQLIEKQAEGLICSILLVEPSGTLYCAAAPGCPPEYNEAINGLKIGPNVGSCGAAAYHKEIVIVTNIATDPLWSGYSELALRHNLRACWSAPILSKDGDVLGTFAIYYRQEREPDPFHLELIQVAVDLAGVAIERTRGEEYLRQSEQRLRLALSSGGLGTWHSDPENDRFIEASDKYKANFGYEPDAEVTYTMLLNAIHDEDRARVQDCVRKSLENNEDYQIEYRCIWPDGTEHWLSAHGSPIYNQAGKAMGMIGVSQDITERKARETQQQNALMEALAWADRDPLTGLLNHRAFHKELKDECVRAQREGTVAAVVMLDLDNFKFFNNVYGHSAGDEVLQQVAKRIQATSRSYDTLARFGGDEFALILSNVGNTPVRDIAARLQRALDTLHYAPKDQENVIPIAVSVGVALCPNHGTDPLEVLKLADERLRLAKVGELTEGHAQLLRNTVFNEVKGFSMLDALVTAVDNKDRYTRRHSEDVMTYCLMIAKELGWEENSQQTLAVSALLHDVGKIGVPDAILRKPGALLEEEFDAIRQHPQMGAIIVSAVPGLEATLDAVRHHHERWDGKGYPDGLAGEAIPLSARLMAVADAFSAMTTDRPYRQGMPTERAFAILESGAGTHWDPACVAAFRTGWQMSRQLYSATPSKD